MNGSKTIFSLVTMATLMSLAPFEAGATDFQGEVIRRAAARRASKETATIFGIKQAASMEDVDLSTELTNPELEQIQTGASRLTARKLRNAQLGSELLQALETRTLSSGNRLKAVFVYVGVTAGDGLGLSGDLALVVGHSRRTGELVAYPMLIVRLKALVIGSDVHFGVGAIEGRSPALTAGLMLGGSLIVGAGVGAGANLTSETAAGEAYLEMKVGLSVEAGGYLGIVL
jgi:hypothetical protein